MSTPLPPPPIEPSRPKAVITRHGRWLYRIEIIDGFIGLSRGWIAFSGAHAEMRAQRKLAWYRRKFGPPREQWTVEP